MKKEVIDRIKDTFIACCVMFCILVIVIWFGVKNSNIHDNTIERVIIDNAEVKIDNLNKDNDSIKLNIKNLKDIKDATVIEISSLNNDSTIKLFYKLVNE